MASTRKPSNRASDLLISPATNLLTGAVFGSALTLSGVYLPSVIISQMQLRNFHMLQSFLTASAVSVLVVQLATKTGYCGPQRKAPSSFLNLPAYSGNILGGFLIGTGMALTGACPGTVLVQGAVGSSSGLKIGVGGILGGIAFAKLVPFLNHSSTVDAKTGTGVACNAETTSNSPHQPSTQYTIPEKLGAKVSTVVLSYEALCITVIAIAATFLANDPVPVNPILGGLAIGGAQALSMLLSRKTIGVSYAYTELGRDFWNVISPSPDTKSSSHSAVWFAIGIIAGARILARQVPSLMPGVEVQNVGPLTSIAGGMVLVFGAALAGGCPSGHGISGMATLSLASFVTVAAMFAGGMAWKALIG